ncbi:MAG TPA: glycosyltransferase family 39 protein [Terriglobales bacterium]
MEVDSTTQEASPATTPAFKPFGRDSRYIIGIVVLWALLYSPGLFRPALLDDADSVHAEAAREILLRHDWVTLYINGIRYLEKAPLMYWSIAASFKVFGIHEWSARLPLALGTLALLLAVFWIAKKIFSDYAGACAAAVLATSFGLYIFTRILIPDVLVALWLTLAMGFFLESLETSVPSRRSCWGIAIACALNVLTKGLIGVVFPVAIIFVFLALIRNLKRLLKMHLLSSASIFLIVAAPWHILAGLRNPAQGSLKGFFWFYFVNEHFLRYLNKRMPRDYDTVPLLLFWALMLVWLLPWSAYLFNSLAEIPNRLSDFNANMSPRARANLLFAVWAALVLLFFTFSTRQEYYVLPALPALALLIGGWMQREKDFANDSQLKRRERIASTVLMIVGILVFTACIILVVLSKKPPAGTDLSQLLSKNPGEYALSFGHIFDLTPRAMGFFRLPLLISGFAFLLGPISNWLLRRRNMPADANRSLVAMMIAILYAAQIALILFEPVLSSKSLAIALKQYGLRPSDVIVINGEYESGSTLNFYLQHGVRILNGRSANLWYGSFFPDAPQIFYDDHSFPALWNSGERVFLFTEEDKIPAAVERKYEGIARDGGKLILSNQPAGVKR